MMKNKIFWHSSNLSNEPKILAMRDKYGSAGYAYYLILCEKLTASDHGKLRMRDDTFTSLAKLFRIDVEDVKKYISDSINVYELFQTDGKYFWSHDLLDLIDTEDMEKLPNLLNYKNNGKI